MLQTSEPGTPAPAGLLATTPALELIGLSKRFGDTIAADHVELVIPSGSFFGLVGPNGAGKTTCCRWRWACCGRTAVPRVFLLAAWQVRRRIGDPGRW